MFFFAFWEFGDITRPLRPTSARQTHKVCRSLKRTWSCAFYHPTLFTISQIPSAFCHLVSITVPYTYPHLSSHLSIPHTYIRLHVFHIPTSLHPSTDTWTLPSDVDFLRYCFVAGRRQAATRHLGTLQRSDLFRTFWIVKVQNCTTLPDHRGGNRALSFGQLWSLKASSRSSHLFRVLPGSTNR